jgi:hypothetical protein
MFIRGFFIFYVFIFAYRSAVGQEAKFLILEKVGSKHRITYTIGDRIIMKLKGEDFEIRDEISDIEDSILFLSDFFIHVSNIEYVKTVHTRGFLSPSNGPKLMIAGGALIVFDLLNQTLILNESYQLTKGVAITSASLVGFGGLLMSFKYRKFKPGKNKRIRTFVM